MVDQAVTEAAIRILRGARNGAVYGSKVRFAHALVMAVLFGKGSFQKRADGIVRATLRHATTLAKFVFIYKSMLLAQALVAGRRRDAALGSAAAATGLETFVAGTVGGYLVFGRNGTPVTEQIVLYLISRVLVGGARHVTAGSALSDPEVKSRAWSATAALAWGLVMYLFHVDPKALHFSLAKSMDYLYVESDGIDDITHFLDLF